jgi:hypothetical protein
MDESSNISGFIRLIQLYRIFDDTFFRVWNRASEGTSPTWISQLQRKLAESLPDHVEYPEVQSVDLKVSQQWLKVMVWQLALNHGFISPMAIDDVLQNKFLLETCQELINICISFSHQAMETHGLILVSYILEYLTRLFLANMLFQAEKLFDVAYVFIDAISSIPLGNGSDPRDCLNRLIGIISTLSSAQPRLISLLSAKMLESHSNHIEGPYTFPLGNTHSDMLVDTSIHQSPLQAMGYEEHPSMPLAALPGGVPNHQYHGQISVPQYQGHLYSGMVNVAPSGEVESEYPGYDTRVAIQVSTNPETMASIHAQYHDPHLPPGTGFLG